MSAGPKCNSVPPTLHPLQLGGQLDALPLLHETSSVDALYWVPWQSGHSGYTEGRKRSSTITDPSPSQVGQCPPATLKENRPDLYPRERAFGVSANRRRAWSNGPV